VVTPQFAVGRLPPKPDAVIEPSGNATGAATLGRRGVFRSIRLRDGIFVTGIRTGSAYFFARHAAELLRTTEDMGVS
jgi:hypothetical protein